jgi:hypothetical protein
MADFMRRLESICRFQHFTVVKRVILNRITPLTFLSQSELRERYSFEPESIHFMLQLISTSIESDTFRSSPLPPIISLLVKLDFFASQAHYLIIGDRHGVSKSSVSRIIKRTSTAICALRE